MKHLRRYIRQVILEKIDIIDMSRKPYKHKIEECIIVGGQASGDNILMKSRDRNYDANVKIVRDLTDDGVEIVYMVDLDSGYIEGMNSEGIGIINSTLDIEDGKEAEIAQPSNSGPRIRKCLSNKNIASTIGDILNFKGGVEGHTIVASPEEMYAIEHPGGENINPLEKYLLQF